MTAADRRSRWVQPAFLLAVGILGVSALGLNVAVTGLQLHFKKQPVPLAADLSTVPARLGPWLQVSIDEPLDHDRQETLGTRLYTFRDYVDTRRVSPAELAEFDGKDADQRTALAAALQLRQPEAVINCGVTYYTGLVDTVAHIPDRCYVASGYAPTAHDVLTWQLGDDFAGNAADHRLEVEAVAFADQAGAAAVTTRVAYFFRCDGVWESDHVAVRERLQDLRATHGYYSKVELRTVIPDAAQSAAVMADFLRSALPAIDRCYPDWAAVEHPRR